jgi:hypothetical protein
MMLVKFAAASAALALFVGSMDLGFGSPDTAQPVAQESQRSAVTSADAPKLEWMVGTWERTVGKQTTVEHWMPHSGTTFMGLSHTYGENRTYFFEFMRIATHGGRIAYIVQPGGDSPVLFRAVKVTEGEAVFENPDHDHPQRIRYVQTEAGMTATISLMDGSEATEFVFERKAEEAEPAEAAKSE